MKISVVVLVGVIIGAAGFVAGHRIAARRTSERPSYLAVFLSGDHFLHSVSTVVEDDEGRYVLRGDEIRFYSRGPETFESTMQPFTLEFQRWDFFSPERPKGAHALVPISERAKEETFIVRDGKAISIDPIARMNP